MTSITCLRCHASFEDENYEDLLAKGITDIAERLYCNKCIDQIYDEEKKRDEAHSRNRLRKSVGIVGRGNRGRRPGRR